MSITRNELLSANPNGVADCLENKHAFIAGAGGLGSNVAMLLVRAGIGRITVVDYDVIDSSNINRQHYFYDQIGQVKVEALKANLNRISPFVQINSVNTKLVDDNFDQVIPSDCDIIFECFDNAICKAEIVRFCLTHRRSIPMIAVSGLAGCGPTDTMVVKKVYPNFYMIGDEESDVSEGLGTLSSRVMTCSAIQAHQGISLLIN